MNEEAPRIDIDEDMLNAPKYPTNEQALAIARLQLTKDALEAIKSQPPNAEGKVMLPGLGMVDREMSMGGLRKSIAGDRIQAGITDKTVQEQLEEEDLAGIRVKAGEEPQDDLEITVKDK